MQLIIDGMKILLTDSGALTVVLGLLSLTGGSPVVDGKVYSNAPAQIVQQSDNMIVVDYSLGADVGQMRVKIAALLPNALTVQYSMRNIPDGRNYYSFGLRFDSVTGVKRYYRSGYQSWDGSYYVQPDALRSLGYSSISYDQGYGVTELIPTDGKDALVMGFDRHDRYQQTFTFGNLRPVPDLTILTLWDQKQLAAVTDASSENLYLLRDPNYEQGLRRWAGIAAGNSPTPPRTNNQPLIGWDSWYNLYNFISEPIIRSTLHDVASVVTQQQLPMKVFIIDSGFTSELGDWLTAGFSFPNGLTPLLKETKDTGFSPGLWIAPLLVGNRSQLYSDHPDWVVKSRATGGPKLLWSFYGEQRLGNMRSEEYYILDITIPDVLEYLRNVFHTWRYDWGVEVFKIDGTVFGLDWDLQDVAYAQPGLTRIEAWRRFAQMIRSEIGNDAIWVASGTPLWASIGIADSIRIDGDVGVDWYGTFSAQSLLRDLPTRNFANNILWQVDPDAVLLRNRYNNLTDIEVRSLALFAAMSGGVMITSDDLAEVSSDRMVLWKSILSTAKASARYPFLGREDSTYLLYQNPAGGPPQPVSFSGPLIVQVRDNPDGGQTVHILNTSQDRVSRTISLTDLGIDGAKIVFDWLQGSTLPGAVKELSVSLDGHSSSLLMLSNPLPLTPVLEILND
jgi:hypothetical protein